MKNVLGVAAVVLGLLAGCGVQPDAGNEYVGKWDGVNNKSSMVIERNGSSFMIRYTGPGMIGELETKNFPGMLKDGLLQMTREGFPVPLAIDKASGNLTDGDHEFKRAN
ncbi:MAG: hypothetical protein FWD50_00660 [Betaproteobacteria bacterium]|nr:hypothetical protein [Betaproteobacteria bacterium]